MKLNETFYLNPNDENSLNYYQERANWCNENNAKLIEIEPVSRQVRKEDNYITTDEGEIVYLNNEEEYETVVFRQFQIVAIPEPTEEEKAEHIRVIRNQYLSKTDKYMLSDYPVTEEEREEYKAYRVYLRDITKDTSFPNVEVLSFDGWKNNIID